MREALDRIAGEVLEAQRARLDELVSRCGAGPALRLARRSLNAYNPLSDDELSRLPDLAAGDREAREIQRSRRDAYHTFRDREARRQTGGMLRRLAQPDEAALEAVDRRWLNRCTTCAEIAYPAESELRHEPFREPGGQRRCHYCGNSARGSWDPGHEAEETIA